MDYLEALKTQVWQKAIKSDIRDINKTYCKLIAQKVATEISTPDISKKMDWETVRDFFEGTRNTSVPTLNKFSAYVLADSEATYANFQTYCETQKERKKSILWTKNKYFKLSIIVCILFLSLIIFFWNKQKNTPSDFKEYFNQSDISELKNWEFEDLDSNYIHLEKGFLELCTLPGDYWVDMREGEKPMIKNFLVQPINCDECEVILKIWYFHPNMIAQQAGLFLLDEKNNSFDKQRYVRCTYAYGGYNNVDESENHWEVIQIVEQFREGAIPATKEIPIRYRENGSRRYIIHRTTRLRIIITKEKYTFYWGAGNVYPNKFAYEIPRIVEPKYLGIGVFQGFTDDRGKPFNADYVPVYIDELLVKPLK
ncbi:MAG: hypothetical protein AAFP82_07020 [Bacteroidota bacterium]